MQREKASGHLRAFARLMQKASCVLLSAALIFTWCVIVPQGGWADDGVTSQYDYILNPDNPTDYDANSTVNPYTDSTSEKFLLEEQNELMTLVSYNEANSKDNKFMSFYDNYDTKVNDKGFTGDMEIAEEEDQGNTKRGWESITRDETVNGNMPGLKFQDSVAFDPTNSGRKDHIAFIGYCDHEQTYPTYCPTKSDGTGTLETKMEEKCIYLWVYNCTKKSCSVAYKLNSFDMGEIRLFESTNLLNLTAGDYDNDGKDSIVVFVAANNGEQNTYSAKTYRESIREYTYNNSFAYTENKDAKGNVTSLSSSEKPFNCLARSHYYINNVFMDDDEEKTLTKMRNKQDEENRIGCHLTTGDLNGDGIDDLAAITYGQEYKELDSYKDYRIYMPMVAAAFGQDKKTEWSIVKNKSGQDRQIQYVALENSEDSSDDVKIYDSMRSPSISAGDVDGDGNDELVLAGFYCSVKYDTEKCLGSYREKIDYKNMTVATISVTDSKISISGKKQSVNKWTSCEKDSGNGEIKPQLAVECVAINGQSAAEFVFINGSLYKYAGVGYGEVFTADYFTSEDSDTGEFFGSSVQSCAVTDTAVGVFDGNDQGREQVIFSTVLRQEKDNDDYFYTLGTISGKNYETDTNIAGGYCSSNISNDHYSIKNKGDKGSNRSLTFTLAAADVDDDGMLGKYSSSSCVYTDPTVAAVLQGAPYFNNLDENNGYSDSGQTSYKLSTTYERGTTNSSSVSFGAGFSGSLDLQALGAVSVSLQAGYSLDWNQTFEKSVATTYTTSFTAQKDTQVIIKRTPVIVYSYDVYCQKEVTTYSTVQNMDGSTVEVPTGTTTQWEWETDGYEISVPKNPTYYQLSVDDYNDFVNDYNQRVGNSIENKVSKAKESLDRQAAKGEIKTEKCEELKKEIDNQNYEEGAIKLRAITSADLPMNTKGKPENYWSSAISMGSHAARLSQTPIALSYSGGSSTNEWNQAVASTKSTETSHGFSFEATVEVGFGLLGNKATAGGYTSLQYLQGKGSFTTNVTEDGASGTVQNVDEATLKSAGMSSDIIRSYGFTWDFYMWQRPLATNSATDKSGLLKDYTPIFGYRVYNVTMPADVPSDLTASLSETDALHSVDLSWSPVSNIVTDPTDQKVERVKGYNVYARTGDGEYEKLNNALITGTNFTATGLNSNTEYSFVVTTVFLKDAKGGGTETTESLYSPEAQITTPRQGYPVTLETGEGLDITMTCGGNELNSGGSVFEGDAVTVKVEPDALHVLKKVTVTKGSGSNAKEADITDVVYRQSNEFSFVVSDATSVKIESALRVNESPVCFQAHPSYGKGSVTATCNGKEFKSGDGATGTVTFTAAPSDGYVLWGWNISSSYDDLNIKTDGSSTFDFTPYNDSGHWIQAIFVEDDPAAPTGVAAANSDTDAYHSVDLSWSAVSQPYATGYNVYLKTDDGYTRLNVGTITGTKFTARNLESNTGYSFVVAAVGSRKTPVGTESTLSPYSKEAKVATPRQSYPITLNAAKGLTITATCNGNEITSGGSVREGEAITVTVTAKQGYAVKQVTLNKGDGELLDMTSASGKFSFVVNDESTVTAIASKSVDTSVITYLSNGNGSVTAVCAGQSFKSGAQVEDDIVLTATPQDGYALKEWIVNTGGSLQTYAANGSLELALTPYYTWHNILAVFVEETDPSVSKTITVDNANGGYVKVEDAQGNEKILTNGTTSILKGTDAIFTAMPNLHYVLKAWTGELGGIDASQTVVTRTVMDDMTVGAEFNAPVKYEVRYSSADSSLGTVKGSVDAGSALVQDTQVTITATPTKDYRLDFWEVTTGDYTARVYDKEIKPSYEYTFNVAEPTNVVAHFTIITYQVSIVQPQGGNISIADADGNEVKNSSDIPIGTRLTATAKATQTDYELDALKLNGNEVSNPYRFNLSEDVIFSAKLTKLHIVNYTAGEHGQLNVTDADGNSIASGSLLREGTQLWIKATPDADYKLSKFAINKMYDDYNDGYTLMLDKDTSITASFTDATFIVNTDKPEGGTVTVRNADGKTVVNGGEVKTGSELTVTAAAKKGYALDAVTVNGEEIDNGSKIVLKQDAQVSANFSKLHTVSLEKPQGGTISVTDANGNSIASGSELKTGTRLTIDAVANSGYELSLIEVNGVKIENGAQIMLEADTSITASYTRLLNGKTLTGANDASEAAQGVELVLPYSSVAFTGKDHKPSVALIVDGAEVSQDSYDVTYQDNTELGTATVIVTGKGIFKGSVSKTFQIVEEPQAYANSLNKGLHLSMSGKKLKLKLGRVDAAQGYDVYAAKANGSYKAVPTVSAATAKKAAKLLKAKKFSKKKAYKVKVVAYRMQDGGKHELATSYELYVAGGKSSKTNAAKIKGVPKRIKLNTGKTHKLAAKIKSTDKKKKLLSKKTVKSLRYYSSDTSIVTVNAKGVIKAKGAGTCTVTVFAANGIAKTATITVK